MVTDLGSLEQLFEELVSSLLAFWCMTGSAVCKITKEISERRFSIALTNLSIHQCNNNNNCVSWFSRRWWHSWRLILIGSATVYIVLSSYKRWSTNNILSMTRICLLVVFFLTSWVYHSMADYMCISDYRAKFVGQHHRYLLSGNIWDFNNFQ